MTREREGGSLPSTFDQEDPAVYEAIGRAIKVARTQQDLSRKELAARSGVSYAYLSDIETGRGRPSSKALFAIAHALGRNPSELLQEAELYGTLHEMATADESAGLAFLGAAPPPAERISPWFHASTTAAVNAPAREDAASRRASTRDHLQRLARSRLAGQRDQARAELHALVDGLPDEDVEMVLELARRLLRP